MNYDSYELINESPVSTIYRVRYPEDGSGECRAVKISTANRQFAKEPHDIHKEIRILSQVSHHNIIAFLAYDVDSTAYRLWMPCIPYVLNALLASPSFTPAPYGASQSQDNDRIEELRFLILTKSIFYQVLQGIEYLHHPCRMIAHRDIKPGNILLTADCQVKLIDFGIAWRSPNVAADNDQNGSNDFWPESPDNMYTEVATGPYRAPELLFGPTSYDPYATDMWSLGATFAEFFTPLRLATSDDDFGADSSDDSASTGETGGASRRPFLVPKSNLCGEEAFWQRVSLFDGERGDIGLAWSIFKVRGTPSEEIWPTFNDLPHAKRVQFESVLPVNLCQFLPNLPSSTACTPTESVPHMPSGSMTPSPLDLVTRLLVYPQLSRLRPERALEHPWFIADGVPLVLPVSCPPSSCGRESCHLSWKEQDLGYWLRDVILS